MSNLANLKFTHGKAVNPGMAVINPTLRGYSPSKPRWKG